MALGAYFFFVSLKLVMIVVNTLFLSIFVSHGGKGTVWHSRKNEPVFRDYARLAPPAVFL